MTTRYGMMPYGDMPYLDGVLGDLMAAFAEPIRVVEVGAHKGETAAGIRERLGDRFGSYRGIEVDPSAPEVVGPLFRGDSRDAGPWLALQDRVHLVLIDGCHCAVHVVCDFAVAGDRCVVGGYVLFHDTNPRCQGVDQGTEPSHPMRLPVDVREGLRLAGLLPLVRTDWELVSVREATDVGGFRCYRRLDKAHDIC